MQNGRAFALYFRFFATVDARNELCSELKGKMIEDHMTNATWSSPWTLYCVLPTLSLEDRP